MAPVLPTCGDNSPITIDNQTGNPIELHISAKGSTYILYLTTGMNSLNICSGSYTYTMYGCGGHTANGTFTTGQYWIFSCP